MDNIPDNYRIYKLTSITSIIIASIKTFGVVVIIYLIMSGLVQIAEHAPEQISSLAKVVEAFGFANWLSLCVSAICGLGWFFERKGKKRAIKEKGKFQRLLEANDPDRTTCGLTETGDTPGE